MQTKACIHVVIRTQTNTPMQKQNQEQEIEGETPVAQPAIDDS